MTDMFTYVDYEGDTAIQKAVQQEAHRQMGVFKKGAEFSDQYQIGVWDGIIDFYDMKMDRFPTGLYYGFIDSVKAVQTRFPSLTYTLQDDRMVRMLDPEKIEDPIELGNAEEPSIFLRDYQQDAVYNIFDQEIGIVEGATNSGKCMPQDALLLTTQGYKSIGQIFYENGTPCTEEEKIVPARGLQLVNRYGQPEVVKHLTFNGRKPLINIHTEKGIKMSQTENHPLLVLDKHGNKKWVPSIDVKVGDYIIGRVGDKVFGNNTTITSTDEAYNVGVVIADGYIGQDHKIDLTSNQTEVIERIKKYFYSMSDNVHHYDVPSSTSTTTQRLIMMDKKAVTSWHEKHGVCYGVAKDKFIPQHIMESPYHIQIAFLSGFIEAEGYFSVQGKLGFEITSASEKIINQLNLLLRNLGITSKVSQKTVKNYEDNNYYRLTLTRYGSIQLLDLLTLQTNHTKEKRKQFFQASKKATKDPREAVVPFGKHLVLEYKKKYRALYGMFPVKFDVPKTINTRRLREMLEKFPLLGEPLYNNLTEIVSRTFVYEKVTKVTSGEEVPTFDVHMPKTHSFISHGIINHNTEVASGIFKMALPHLQGEECMAFFTDKKNIFSQSSERVAKRLNLDVSDVGMLGAGKRDFKNKKIVFVMIPTLNSALKDPTKGSKDGMKLGKYEKALKYIAEEVSPLFRDGFNCKVRLQNYIRNNTAKTVVWKDAQDILEEWAYESRYSDANVKLKLRNAQVDFDKLCQKKNNKKYKKYKEVQDFMQNIRVMICDEAHHAGADTWYNNLLTANNAQIRVALTGSIQWNDPMLSQRMRSLFNDVVSKVTNDEMVQRGISAKPKVNFIKIKEPTDIEHEKVYMTVYEKGIVHNKHRNESIAKIALHEYNKDKGATLISVSRIDHGENIGEELKALNIPYEFIHGELEDELQADMIKRVKSGETKVIIATSVLEEGVDISGLSTLILSGSKKSLRIVLQLTGRVLRRKEDDNTATIYDFIDLTNKYLKNHSRERYNIFKDQKFEVKILN